MLSISSSSPLSCCAISLLTEDATCKPNQRLSVSAVQSNINGSSRQRNRTRTRAFDYVVCVTGLVAVLLFLRAFAGPSSGTLRGIGSTLESEFEPVSSARFSRHLGQKSGGASVGLRQNTHEHHFVDADGAYSFSVICNDDHTGIKWGWLKRGQESHDIPTASSADLDNTVAAET